MGQWQETATIDAPAAQVFAYVSDFNRHGEWSGHGLQVTQDDDGPVSVGTSFSTVAKQFGTQRERSVITDLDSPNLFAWDSTGGLGTIHHAFALSEVDGTTTLTRTAEFKEKSMLAKLFGFRLKNDLPASLREDLAKIKATVESGS